MVFLVGKNAYTLAYEHKNGWNPEAFRERYSEILDRYDYIVGDWGYNQLRLRGFFKEGHPRAPKDAIITSLMDYIQEYCNFGCAYFVLAKIDPESVPPGTPDLLAGRDNPLSGLDPETAAASAYQNGVLMRWPIKERSGGPVWTPGAAAVARAVAEAERQKMLQAQAAQKSGEARGAGQGYSQGAGGKASVRSGSGGAGKAQGGSAGGQAEPRGKQKNKGARSGQAERHRAADNKAGEGWRRTQDPDRNDRLQEESGSSNGAGAAETRTGGPEGRSGGSGKSGGRWHKHRRKSHKHRQPETARGEPDQR